MLPDNTFSREDILAKHPLLYECEKRGMKFKKVGSELTAICPFHNDGKRGNFRLNEHKQTWFCDVCGFGGSAVDYVSRLEGKSASDIYREWARDMAGAPAFTPAAPPSGSREVATYDYVDESGDRIFQVVRYEPKTFRQRRMVDGKWVWNMEGVTRILYKLPEVLKAETVWICEGEKDCDNLAALGFVATCNVGGGGKWLDAYAESLKGKDIILCGDNDDTGKKHMDGVLVSIRDCVKSVKMVRVPAPHKDVSDMIASFELKIDAVGALEAMSNKAPIIGGFHALPVKGMEELEAEYCEYVKQSESVGLDLSRWLPSLRGKIRPLVPGELAVFIADTGVGKTALLQNMAFKAGITSLLFELELPGTLTFERFLAIASNIECSYIEDGYRIEGPGKINFSKLRHVWVCDKSGLSIADMKRLIQASALKIGKTPSLVLVDYVQLVRGDGKTRYERTSSVAEDLKVMAKELNVIVVAASQISRKADGGIEVGLHDAKNAGEIENSAGLVIGVWRDPDQPATMHLKILKNTKGGSGTQLLCNFKAATMQITEQSPIEDSDVPVPYRD